MTYRVRIEEIKGNKLVKLFDKNVDKGIMKIGDTVGMIGFDNPIDIMMEVEDFIRHLAVKMVGLNDEDEPNEELILAAAITECIIGINLASIALGPITETGIISDEDKRIKLRKYVFELIEKGKEIAGLCGIIHVDTMDEYKQKLGELIMDELEESEKRDKKEKE